MDREIIESHVELCARCAAELGDLAASAQMLSAEAEPGPMESQRVGLGAISLPRKVKIRTGETKEPSSVNGACNHLVAAAVRDLMKSIVLLLCVSTALLAQPLSFGIKAGVPMTDFLDTVDGSRTSITSTTNRYIVGPTLELRLPAGFGVEVDALYRHFRYDSVASLVDAVSTLNTSGGAWEFPLLLKKRLFRGPIRPFVDAGISFNKIAGLSQTVQTVVFPNRTTTVTSSSPAELKDSSSAGFTMGGGVEIKALLLRITPEIRYTRWSTQHFNAAIFTGSLGSNLNQAEFLVGFTF